MFQSPFPRVCLNTLLVLSVFVLSACASTKAAIFPPSGRADFDLAQGIRFYEEANVYLGQTQVNIRPNINLDTPPTALFMPFGMVQEARDHSVISQGVSRLIWQQFLAEETFSVLEFANASAPYRLEYALNLAKSKQAQFLVGGTITYFLDGGTTADSKFAMQLEIYDTNSGMMVWSINQSGVIPYKFDRDYALFRIKHRMPMDPMSYLISAVARITAVRLHEWTNPILMEERKTNSEKGYFDYLDPPAFGS